ncbi:MAG: E3 ubiquitin-protein ligase bre1 [Claussenomyces sp. TS43310]|nr:MAG: E3 ubiquitin-protein ligase bre1 [Claussenomyces sp. TS43310]
MEDRKRPAGQNVDELAPPTKRQAVNGSGKASADADMPWKEDLENYQKDAIYRQMLEYKRERATLESQLKDVQKRSVDHDDHLRVIDAWWSELLDEVTLLSRNVATSSGIIDHEVAFPTALLFKSSTEFSEHLSKKAKDIKVKVNEIFSNISNGAGPQPQPDLQGLQHSLTALLASQKEQMVKFDRLRAEKEDLNERLETASLRYIKAEKRLDRAKSAAVAKIEQQAHAGASNNGGSGVVENGLDNKIDLMVESGAQSEASQLMLREASAAVTKQKEQLDSLTAENRALTEQLTTASTRLTNLSDDDYARTELFKNFKAQHDDVIKRINHLEATNIALREEAERLQAERTAFRLQMENEAEVVTGELDSQLQRVEADLTRIRSARDELLADQATRKAHQDQERSGVDQMKELVGAKDDRISSLESEVQRLRSELDRSCEPIPQQDIRDLDIQELQRKYVVLEQSFASVNNELPAMEKAYKRSMAMASKKVMDFATLEDRVTLLIAEKSKADQKYFAARKDMDTRLGEVRALRAQNAKSSEIITQLKEVEASNRILLTSLEKQLSDLRQANSTISAKNKSLESSASDAGFKLETLRTQVNELTSMIKTKDAVCSSAKQHVRSLETDFEQLRARYDQIQKEKETWKAKSLSNQSGEEEMLRTLALCTVCRKEFKNTVLKSCGHLFCRECVDDRLTNRMRKCPICAKSFDRTDVLTVHM